MDKIRVDYSKRSFIRYLFPVSLVSVALIGMLSRKPLISLRDNSKINKKIIISPPGSQSISSYLDSCTACHICVNSCPTKVLRPAGFADMMQPTLDYSHSYCDYECNICSRVCPNGAIKPLKIEEKKKIQVGKVKLIEERCVVYKSDLNCGACAEHCPTTAVYMVPYKGIFGPKINIDFCIGCGACEHVCPALPEKAIRVEGNKVHHIAKERPKEKIIDKSQKQIQSKEEDFPF